MFQFEVDLISLKHASPSAAVSFQTNQDAKFVPICVCYQELAEERRNALSKGFASAEDFELEDEDEDGDETAEDVARKDVLGKSDLQPCICEDLIGAILQCQIKQSKVQNITWVQLTLFWIVPTTQLGRMPC